MGKNEDSPEIPLASIPFQKIPVCPPELKPAVGMLFVNLEAGIEFYEKYAKTSGFVTRLGSSKMKDMVVRYKYVLCNKAGDTNAKGKHRRSQFRVGCNASIKIKLLGSGAYQVYDFVEAHNHNLNTPNTMVHLTQSRSLNVVHKKIIIDNAKTNHGPVKSFRMFKEYVRGYRNVGASQEDFKNFSRDVKRFIKSSDAQMLVEKFMHKKSVCSSFFFDFDVDKEGRLSRLFWADPICIKNNYLFGENISFDSTFDMNTYKMVFAPFTGVDNHKKCIIFGAGLIAHEDIESFSWLFESFLKAMGGRYPKCIITDQCLGIKGAVEKVFGDKTRHRYCMWHILKKLPEKVGHQICHDTTFVKEIHALIWGEDVERSEFEERWDLILAKHGLSEHKWLNDMHKIREYWIPAYFRDLFLGGLMRTTSRSESENNFFSNFTNPNLTLVEFWMRFDSAMDAQRWKQSKLIADSKNTNPRLETPLTLEKHAAEIYTPTIFYEFQEELKGACFNCGVESISGDDFYIKDHDKQKVYVVKFKSGEGDSELECYCVCRKFEMHGILCRHALLVLKEKGFDRVPSKYVLMRWSKLVNSRPIFDANGTLLEDCITLDVENNKTGELWSQMFNCVALVEQNPEGVDELIDLLHSFKEKYADGGTKIPKDKNAELEMLIGTKIPSEVTILPPKQSKNKGSGKRLVSEREKAAEQRKKAPRLCAFCGKVGFHDSRTCPDNPNRKKK